jgi:hypothetical protein
MYANSVGPEVGDIVQGATGLGEVLAVTPNEMGGHVCVTVQWRTPAMNTAQDAQSLSPAPILAQSLTFVRRK